MIELVWTDLCVQVFLSERGSWVVCMCVCVCMNVSCLSACVWDLAPQVHPCESLHSFDADAEAPCSVEIRKRRMQYRSWRVRVTSLHLSVLLVARCTEMSWLQFLRKYFCSHVCCVFVFSIHYKFPVNVFLLLFVTNLLINCEGVSCPLTCVQITSWFWFI